MESNDLSRKRIDRCGHGDNGRLNGGGALICKRWNFRERRDRTSGTRNDRRGKGRKDGRRVEGGGEGAFPSECRARAIPVIASVYIVPLTSGVSRTAFVLGRLWWERSRPRKIAEDQRTARDPPRPTREDSAAGSRFSRSLAA